MNEILAKLMRRGAFGIKFGLDVTEVLLEELGHPERAFLTVHVAGTNGKGSVCAMLESVLRHAGLPTGLYTSPHLVRFNERMVVNGRPITDAELDPLCERIEAVSECVERRLGRQATFFECGTAMAFDYFRSKGVRVAVIETGMGGRLDATNVILPVVSVITRISVEHTQYLGKDVPTIAGEKAGIVKAGRPVVVQAGSDEAMGVISRVAAERKAPLIDVAQEVSVRRVSETWEGQKVTVESQGGFAGTLLLPLLGDHQLENLATVVAASEALREAGLPLSDRVIRSGVGAASWPGRLQVLEQEPLMILDGAHNPGGAEVLASFLKRRLKREPLALVTGMCADKDVRETLRGFAGLVRRVWAVPLANERSLPAAELAALAKATLGVPAEVSDVRGAMVAAREWAMESGGAVCIAGSLYLAGEVLSIAEGDWHEQGC
jgi:dihydrofolate synthase/folylpolyglutamate synthase